MEYGKSSAAGTAKRLNSDCAPLGLRIACLALSLMICLGAGALAQDVSTTTEVTFLPVSVVVGQSVNVTWTVTAQTTSVVAFGGNLTRHITSPSASDVLNDSVVTSGGSPFTSTFGFTPTQVGSYTAQGTYEGCPGCTPVLLGSTYSDLLSVSKADTSVAVSADVNPSVVGEDVTFTATVTPVAPGAGTPTGTVTFYEGATMIGQDTDGTDGWDLTYAFATVGSKSITASYSGDASFNGSTSGVHSQTVNQATTQVEVTSAPSASVTGQDVTYTAEVSAVVPGSGVPTGNVTITVRDNLTAQAATSGALALDGSGRASFTTNLLKASGGPYSTTAVYAGDTNYVGSDNTGSPHAQTVNKADTSITIDSDNPDPSMEGQAYTVTWSVTVDGPGSSAPGAPTGNVDVEDDDTPANTCSDVVGNGATGCSLSGTPAGTATITATYAGDADYNESDTTTSHTINSNGTSISVISNHNPSLLEEFVLFTATLTPDSSGGPAPTGSVTFRDTTHAVDLGTDTDGTDGWSLSHQFTTAGSRNITAQYSGDSVYAGSTSSAISQVVNKLDVTLSITGAVPEPSEVSEPYTVSWTYTDPSATLVPSGDVTVSDGTPPSSAAVDITVLSASLTSTTAGPKTLVASYEGDANFNPTSATAPHQVNKDTVTFSVVPSNAPWISGTSGTFDVTVTPDGPSSALPTGTVTFHIQDKNGTTISTSGPHFLGLGQATSDAVVLTAAQSQVSVQVSYSGDSTYYAGTDTHLQDVIPPASFAIVSDEPDPSSVGETFYVEWTYGAPGVPNDGTVQVIESGTGIGSPIAVTAGTTGGIIPCTLTTAGSYSLDVRYDDTVNATFTVTPVSEPHDVVAYSTTTTLSLAPTSVFVNQPTTLTAQVLASPTGSPGLPGRPVEFVASIPPGSDGNLSAAYCILVGGADNATCSLVTYTPTVATSDGETHLLRAAFPGDATYGASQSAFESLQVSKRPPDVTVDCLPEWVYVDQETTCTVTVSDSTGVVGTTIPTGDVSLEDFGKVGVFSPSDTGTLTHGTVDISYTPAAGDAGTSSAITAIRARYPGSSVYLEEYGETDLEVRLRPTEITVTWEDSQGGNEALFLQETGRVFVTVTDIGPTDSASPPQGTILATPSTHIVSSNPAILVPISANASQATFHFRRLTMTEAQEFVNVTGTYTPITPATHDSGFGSTDVSVQKRTTETVLSCMDSSPYTCTATVTDTASRGTSIPPAGQVIDQKDGTEFCAGGVPGSCTKNYDTTEPMIEPVAVGYVPTDDIHMESYGMDTIERPIPVGPGDCRISHIEDSILGLSITCTVMSALQVLLESGAAAADIIADPVWTAIFPGSTVPIGDMISTALTGLSLHGEIAIQTMCTDVDGDGIFGSIEAVIAGIEDHNWDSDNDGMGDLEEIDEAGGDLANSYDVSKHTSCPCPNPTISDSDGDDIKDGNEQGDYVTDFCNDDTDEDGIDDGQEVGTFSAYPSDSGATITPRTDPRDHANPLAQDTDGDGLDDAFEFTPGRLATSITDINYSSFINDADSDDDDLQDGFEDLNGDGRWSGTIGDTSSAGSGETHLCLADTDGDGLSDGEEVALFGAGPVHVVTPTGSLTTPPLDTDSDNDGLSDYEEVNITQTDPLDFDTDDDGLWDVNELIAVSGTWPQRSFVQVSDPLDPDTDDDDIPDANEYDGTGLGLGHGLGGSNDTHCPFVNDADSDNDGLQDGVEDANHDGTWGLNGGGITIGGFSTQAAKTVAYWETDPCNPDTDGDGIRDGEEANLIGGGPTGGRPVVPPGFHTVTPEGRSTVMPVGPDYSGGPLFTFTPTPGLPIGITVPALDVDSDNDGLSDYEEVNITGTDPLDADSDNDTLMDSDELVAIGGTIGSTPRRTFDQESDPLDINTDDDHLFDPVEGECGNVVNLGTGLSAEAGGLGGTRDTTCPFINDDDSDDDGVQDGAVIPISRQGPGLLYSYIFIEGFEDVPTADVLPPGTVRVVVTPATGEQSTDTICNVCDPDSDSDGLTDGEEVGIGTDPQDWDTDDDGRGDWHEHTGGGPIATDPFDPDTDDDGLLDSAEVFGANPTNPVNADTDGDGLCDGGAGTPHMVSGHPTVLVNPICKSCSTPGLTDCGAGSARAGSPDGIGDHPNRLGLGEDQSGNGAWDGGETDPNQYDTDGDAIADGIERLAYSTSRQTTIPPADQLGRPILVTYPEANNVKVDCGCMDPLVADTDGDGLTDGFEDSNHDGNFDFLPSEFDYYATLPGPPIPDPSETNPCEADTDHDGLTDWEERFQRQPLAAQPPLPLDNDDDGQFDEDPVDGIDNDYDGLIDEDPVEGPIELTFNQTNPLDHDTDNDRILDGPEVDWVCEPIVCSQLDNDTDALINEDPIDGLDNDGDGLFDEDPVDFIVRSIPWLDPTSRDSDADGYLDGLDDDPCNSECIPVLVAVQTLPIDTDGDGFSDEDELFAGTHPNDPEDHPIPFGTVDLDFDTHIDDRVWLEPVPCCDLGNSVIIDIDSDALVDMRIQTLVPRNIEFGDFDGDGFEDDVRYRVEYALSNYRVTQPRVLATIDDYDGDLIIDWVVVEQK